MLDTVLVANRSLDKEFGTFKHKLNEYQEMLLLASTPSPSLSLIAAYAYNDHASSSSHSKRNCCWDNFSVTDE